MTRMTRALGLLAHARRILREPPHLNGVRFVVNDRFRSTLARCDTEQRVIELGPELLLRADDATFDDVVVHELAHLLSGDKTDHGPAWRAWFMHLGGSGNTRHKLVCR